MAVILALLEGSSIVAVACAVVFIWAHPVSADWLGFAPVIAEAFALSLGCVAVFYYTGLYDFRTIRRFGEFTSRLPRPFALAAILLAGFYSLFPETRFTAGPFVASMLAIAALVLALRAVWYGLMRRRAFMKRALIVGTTPLAHALIEEIEAQPHRRYDIVGLVDDPTASDPLPFRYPRLGSLQHLSRIIDEVHPDRIIIALGERRSRLPVGPLLNAWVRGIVLEDGVDAYERLTGKLAIESLTPSDVMFSKDFRPSRLHLAVARGLSLLVAVIALGSLAPLLGLIALAIKLESRGPVFFVQDRVGLGGKRFTLLKFRTMRPGDGETPLWFRDSCDRITRVGKWLRKFRLDELPQFVNILRGDMNLVGPRPHRVAKFEVMAVVSRNAPECGGQIPYLWLRSVVRPGLTGWAQVRNGYASDLEGETEKIRYDLHYIKRMSLWFDLRILFDTVKIVLSGHGSGTADTSRTEAAHGRERPMTPREGHSEGRLNPAERGRMPLSV